MGYGEADGPECTKRFGVPSAYLDAVGDLAQLADPAVAAKWGPSIGWFQIRALRHPEDYPVANGDRLRVAEKLRDVRYNVMAAAVISNAGADWSKWTIWRTGAYKQWLGMDYELRTGHPRAGEWSA